MTSSPGRHLLHAYINYTARVKRRSGAKPCLRRSGNGSRNRSLRSEKERTEGLWFTSAVILFFLDHVADEPGHFTEPAECICELHVPRRATIRLEQPGAPHHNDVRHCPRGRHI